MEVGAVKLENKKCIITFAIHRIGSFCLVSFPTTSKYYRKVHLKFSSMKN